MHTTLVRIQNVFGYFTTVAFALGALVAFSVVFSPQSPSANVSIRNVQVVKGRPHYYSSKKEEYAHIKFDLDADFTSLFNWNTKQLFIYILATYPSLTPSSPPSQAIIWDLIIPSPSQLHPFDPWAFLMTKNAFLPPSQRAAINAKSKSRNPASAKDTKAPSTEETTKPGRLSLKNVKPKYQITDISGKLAERGNVTLEVGWNVQPWVGALTWTMSEGKGWGRWKGMQGGGSEAFVFPPLKGKKVETTVGSRETPRAAEASPVV